MVNYRRARLPGVIYFFTVALRDRRSRLLTEHVEALRDVVQCVKRQWPFRIDALVVLPDHLHAVWTLPSGDADFSKRWQAIKAQFTRRLVKRGSILAHDRGAANTIFGNGVSGNTSSATSRTLLATLTILLQSG